MQLLKLLAISGLLVGGSFTLAPEARADEAGDVFERCANRVNTIRERAIAANERTAHRTAQLVKRLLDEGKEEAARRAAANGIQRIERQTKANVKAIQGTCRNCIRKLKQLGADELAERMAALCRNSNREVNQSARTAIARIRNLFD